MLAGRAVSLTFSVSSPAKRVGCCDHHPLWLLPGIPVSAHPAPDPQAMLVLSAEQPACLPLPSVPSSSQPPVNSRGPGTDVTWPRCWEETPLPDRAEFVSSIPSTCLMHLLHHSSKQLLTVHLQSWLCPRQTARGAAQRDMTSVNI